MKKFIVIIMLLPTMLSAQFVTNQETIDAVTKSLTRETKKVLKNYVVAEVGLYDQWDSLKRPPITTIMIIDTAENQHSGNSHCHISINVQQVYIVIPSELDLTAYRHSHLKDCITRLEINNGSVNVIHLSVVMDIGISDIYFRAHPYLKGKILDFNQFLNIDLDETATSYLLGIYEEIGY